MTKQLTFISLSRERERKQKKDGKFLRRFLLDECSKEPGAYKSALAIKQAEIATIKKMLNILHNMNWSGAVYNAISRVTASGIDDNPESGYDLKYEIDILDGLHKFNYIKSDRNIAKFDRVAVKLSLGSNWVWVSFDAFSQSANEYVLPTTKDREIQQKYVKNMRVFKSAAANVHITAGATIAQGNLEIWVDEQKNRKRVENSWSFGWFV